MTLNKLLLTTLLLLIAAPAAANPLTPWRTGAAPRGADRLLGVKWGEQRGRAVAQAADPAAAAPASESAAVKAAGLVPLGGSCENDQQCVEGTYCDGGSCVKVQRPINILYLYYKSADRKFTQLLGIYWHQQGEQGYRVVAPFYWHTWDPQEETRLVFPLYWQFEDKVAQTRSIVVPPFQFRRTPKERNYRLWPLVFYTDYGERGSGITVLPFFHRAREGTRTSTIVPLLLSGYEMDPAKEYSRGLIAGLYYWHNTKHSRTKALIPLFYHRGNDQGSFLWALPLNFHRRVGQRSSTVLFPLYWRFSSPERTTAVLAPLALYQSWDNDRRSRLLSPLFLYERDDAAQVRHWGTLVPPFYHRRDAEREVDVLPPVFMRWRNKIEQTTTWLAGPVVAHSDPDGGTLVAFPLFWRFSDGRSGAAASILFPLAYRRTRPGGGSVNLFFPVYVNHRPERWSAGLLPLLHFGSGEGRRHAVLFPLLWHLSDPKASTTVVGPVFHRRDEDGWRAGLAPLLFFGSGAQGSHQVLFPIFWHLRDLKAGTRTVVAGPGFYRSSPEGRVFGVLPLFAAGSGKESSFQTVLPPLFYRKVDHKNRSGFTLAGLYYGWHAPDERGHAVFPLAYFKRAKGQATDLVLPLFYHRRGGGSRLLITPLGGYHSDAKKGVSEGLIGPYAWHRGPTAKGFAIIPLFLHYTRPKLKASTTVLLPIGVRHVSPERTAHVWFPLFWRFTSPRDSSLVLFPIYWRVREQGGTNADVVFPIYWNVQSPGHQLRVLGPVFSRKTPQRYVAGVFPLAYYHRNKQGSYLGALPFVFYRNNFKTRTRTLVVGPFYRKSEPAGTTTWGLPLVWHKRSSDSDYTVVLPIFWHFAWPREKSSVTFAGPAFYRRKGEVKSVGLAPMFYTSWEKDAHSVALAPLFYYRKEIARRALLTPLFGFDRSPERKLWYAGLYLQSDSPESTLKLFAPLVMHHRNKTTGRTTAMALPLYFGFWQADRSFHAFFPLVFRHATVDRTATVVLPLFWDFNNRHLSRTTLLLPFFLRHRDHLAKSTSYVVPPGLWIRTRPKGTDAVLFPLVWHFGGEQRSTTVAAPLYYDFKRGKKRTTVFFPLFWRFDKPGSRAYFVVNTYYSYSKRDDTYNLLFLPLLQVARKRPGDIKVEFIGGVAGYERIGKNRLVTVMFIDFELQPTSGKTLSGFGGTRRMSWDEI